MIRWIYAFIDRPTALFAQSAAFWTQVTGTALSARRGAGGEFATLLPPEGDPYLKLQGVDDGGGAHLDLAVEDVFSAVGRARDLGAGIVVSHAEWAVLRSPGGQLFCVVPWHGEAVRPAALLHPDGTGSCLDQVCIDTAATLYDAEVAFWAALTGWALCRGVSPEFSLLRPPANLAVRILVQCLDSRRPTSAHLDLACSDYDAARVWHEDCGARMVGSGRHWFVMRDPTGGIYCLTRRAPDVGSLS